MTDAPLRKNRLKPEKKRWPGKNFVNQLVLRIERGLKPRVINNNSHVIQLVEKRNLYCYHKKAVLVPCSITLGLGNFVILIELSFKNSFNNPFF